MLRTSNLGRNKLIVSQEIFFWEETATILPSIPLTSGMVMKSSTNPSVRFPVGPSQVLSRWSGYREGHNPGIVESRTHISGCQFIQEYLRKMSENSKSYVSLYVKCGVGNFGETVSSALEFENTQPEKISHFLTEPLLQRTRTRT